MPNLDIYHMRTEIIDEQGKITSTQTDASDEESVYEFMWNVLFGGRMVFLGDFLYRASSFKKNGGYFRLPYAWHSDRITAFIVARRTGIGNTHSPGFQFRISRYEVSSDVSLTDSKVKIWDEIKKWYISFFSENPKNINHYDQQLFYQLKNRISEIIENGKLIDIDTALCTNKWYFFHIIRKYRSLNLNNRVLRISLYNFFRHLMKIE